MRRPSSFPGRALVAALILAAASLAPTGLRAQVTERPVAFDSAQRVLVVTPALVRRLALAAPAWSVSGDFREARLYATGDSTHVLVVTRPDGALERYPLDTAALAALRAALAEGMARAGNPTTEPGSHVISEPAGFAFARNQLIVGALVYGPALAALSDDEQTASAMYLIGTATPFFIALGKSRNGSLTRAQNDLATDAGPRFALMASGAYYAATGSRRTAPYQATVLGGALAGTIAGLRVGRSLTDGEAAAMATGSSVAAALTAGVMGTAGRFREKCESRSRVYTDPYTGQQSTYLDEECHTLTRADYGVLVGAALAGYPLGLRYVRTRPYAITAGDVRAIGTAAVIGVTASTLALEENVSTERVFGTLTTGLVAGLVAGDRLLARRFDYTRGEGLMLAGGAIGGGLLGLVLPTLAESGEWRAYAGGMTLGAVLGTMGAHALIAPRPAGVRTPRREARGPWPEPGARGTARVQLELDPTALALAATRQPGRHGIVSLRF